MADANRCVMCGEIIPEGRQVCAKCETSPPSTLPLFVIRHRESGRLVTGTDFLHIFPKQILSAYEPPLLLTGHNLLSELKRRRINMKHFTVVRVTVEEVKK